MRKLIAYILSVSLAVSMIPLFAFAEETDTEQSYQTADFYYSQEKSMAAMNAEDAVDAAAGITKEMCRAAYWIKLSFGSADEVLLTKSQIADINASALKADTLMYDMLAVPGDYNADKLASNLANETYRTNRDAYIDGVKVDRDTYFAELKQCILDTSYTGTCSPQYAVAVDRADLKAWPIAGMYTFSSTDPDEESQNSALCVNEPFIIKQTCSVDDVQFYWGYTSNCSGWVKAEDLAICQDRDQWLDAWYVDLDGEDFITVTQNKIILEPSVTTPYSSEVKLTVGTVLKLLSASEKEDAAALLGERNTWNNYVVWLPTRNEAGMYEKKPALISQHYNVNVGFLPYTQKEVLQVAFSCLGDRYGWGGSYGAMDCTLYTRSVLRCFGLELPRNTTSQPKVPGAAISLEGMSDTDRQHLLETMPAGALLFFSGHGMMYTGSENGIGYVISSVATIYDTNDEVNGKYRSAYNVIINPLTVKRGNGNSWLHNLSSVVDLTPARDIADCDIKLTADKDGNNPSLAVSFEGKPLYEGVNYSVSYTKNQAKGALVAEIEGIRNFTGTRSEVYLWTPKSTGISSLKGKKKAFTAKWKKAGGAVTGYELRYSRKASMAGAKLVTVNGAGTLSKKVGKLKARKKYYVQVRTVNRYNGKVARSAWSPKKVVKIRR